VNLYSAQRTNFQPTMPRIATQPGAQRRPEIPSMNRGKKNPVNDILLTLMRRYVANGR